MYFENELVETSIESVGKVADVVFGIIFFLLLNLLFFHALGHFGKLEEEFENLNLNTENVMMGQFKQHIHFIFKKFLELRTTATHN